jgi:uncharacterized RDD family membrane protein YckC
LGEDAAVSELPSYPKEAAEREAVAPPPARELASWGSRVAAYLLDSLLLLVPLAALGGIILLADPDDSGLAWVVVGFAYPVTLVLPFAYFTYFHGGGRGQTYGKRALGIRVVDPQGGPIGYGRAFGRYAITFLFAIFALPILLDYLWPLWDAENQALHDKVVGSLVVRA